MNGLLFRVGCKRLLMQLQHPSPERYIATLSMAGLLLLACVALDFYSSQTLASSARLGAQFRSQGAGVAVTTLDTQDSDGSARQSRFRSRRRSFGHALFEVCVFWSA